MQGFDDVPRQPSWLRVARPNPPGASKNMASLIGQELRHVFPLAQISPQIERLRRLLEELEKKRGGRG